MLGHKNSMTRWLLVLVLMAAALGTGCADEIVPPTAKAAETATARVGETVTLDASTSSDPQDLSLSYQWRFRDVPAGSQVEFNDPTLVKPSFVPDMPGTYVAELVVSNGMLASEPIAVSVEVTECGSAAPSLANLAASPAQPHVDQAVRLSVDASDADNAEGCGLGQTLTYHWSIAQLPAGSQTALNNPAAATPSFTPDMAGDYILQVQVTDSSGLESAIAELTVTASDCGANAPDAGAITATPSSASIGQPIQLTASPSDQDNAAGCDLGQGLSMHWRLAALPPGSQASLNQTSARNPSFVPDVGGDYTVELVVTDSTGMSSAPAEVTVNVSTCGTVAPSINSVDATPSSTPIGQSVQLSADVTDADNQAPCNMSQTFTYQWALLGMPAGSVARLSDATAAQPTLVPDVPGIYTVELVVTDANGLHSQHKYVTITASDCGTADPVALIEEVYPNASPGAAATITGPDVPAGTIVQISGQASYDSDNSLACQSSQGLTYNWAMMAMPAGSSVSLNHNHIVNPWFRPDVAGVYVVELQVVDVTGRVSDRASFTITATPLVGVQTMTGFTTTTVTTGSMLDRPSGVTGDGSGSLFVVQNNGQSVLKIDPNGSLNVVATGGMLRDPTGVAYNPNTGDLFVSASNSRIIRIDQNGGQQTCVNDWGADFRDLAFYSGTQGDRILAAVRDQDEIWSIDPTNCQVDHQTDFNGNLRRPWGVDAMTINGNDHMAASSDRNGEVWRGIDDVYNWSNNHDRITDRLFEPRGVAYTPCSNPKILVADRAGGTVTAFDNCGGNNCASQTLISGLGQPTGLHFDTNGDLIVTDASKQAVFRVSGNFCGL